MMKYLFIGLSVLSVIYSRAQTLTNADSVSEAVHFVRGLTWKEVVAKAKMEKKCIFVDCYTTWCAPCRKMDREVYSMQDVGKYFDEHYIAVKAQIDTSKNDDAATRAFYRDAAYLSRQYKVNLYPTLLFFNPEGKILNRASGAMDADVLVHLAAEVQDPRKDYYTLLETYKKGGRNMEQMAFLARTALRLLGDTVQSEAIAYDYMESLTPSAKFAKSNIEFMREFTNRTTDPGFHFFFTEKDSINKIMMDEDCSQAVIQSVLFREIVAPQLAACAKEKATPRWQLMALTIAGKYGQYYADRTILGAESDWCARQKDWSGHTKYLVMFVEKFGPVSDSGSAMEAFYLNNCAWDIFIHSTDNHELNIGLKWSLRAVMMDPTPGWIDTYANILYKLKRRDLALKWESIAATLARGDRAIGSNYESMKEGKYTWPTK